jgi:hypothetical protein
MGKKVDKLFLFVDNILHKKDPKKLHQKLLDSKNSFRIQNQTTTISSLSIHQQWTHWEQYREITPLTIASNKIPRNKVNKGYERAIQGKL